MNLGGAERRHRFVPRLTTSPYSAAPARHEVCAPLPMSVSFHAFNQRGRQPMFRYNLITLLAGAMLVAFAALPAMLPASTALSLSGSALAQKVPETNATNLNSSRSNNYRRGGGGGAKTTKRTGKTTEPSAPGVINLNSSRSNNY